MTGSNDGQNPDAKMPKATQYALGVYVVGIFFVLLYLLIKTWPLNLGATESTDFFWGPVMLHPEHRLLFVAAIAGALGSYVHLATSFADFAGNERLTKSWGWWYLLRPFIGMALAEVVYVALRAGLFSAGGSNNNNTTTAINPYGVAALAALTGLFAKQATDKLQEVFETLFRTEKKVERKDPLPQTGTPPSESKAATASAGSQSQS